MDGAVGEKRLAMRHIIKEKLEEMQNKGSEKEGNNERGQKEEKVERDKIYDRD